MAHYSILNLKEINQICDHYGIEEVHSFRLLSGGSENTNYLISTDNLEFVVTVCEQKTIQNASELGYLLEHLATNKFETSKLIRTKGNEVISVWNGKPVMLKSFLEGKIIKDLPEQTLEKIGLQLGRLHQIDPPTYLPKKLNYGIEYFHEVAQYAPDSSFNRWIKEIENYIEPFFSAEMPKALIHSDVFFSNVIINKDRKKTYIMDFEEAANYYRIFDLGMTFVGLCCDEEMLIPIKARALFKGYQKEVSLSSNEIKALQAFTVYAAASMTFWRHRNFNHIKPNPEMYDHYLGLKAIADTIKNMPASTFSKILD